MTPPVLRQRAALCSLLDSLSEQQWKAETLCEGWDADDMVNHLLVRERTVVPAMGIVIKPLAGLHDRAMDKRGKRTRQSRMANLRSGPTPWWRYGPTADIQVGEDWIHTQDIARGGAAEADGADLSPSDGTEDPEIAKLLWKAVGRFAPMTLGRSKAEGTVALTDGTTTRTYRLGGSLAKPAKGASPDVTLTAPVGELVLWVTGRRGVSVEVEGKGDLHDELSSSNRSF